MDPTAPHGPGPGLPDAGADLLLGGACAGCGAPGRVLCRVCEGALPRGGRPVRAGSVTAWVAAPYDGLVRDLVVAHKERGLLGLRRPLGMLLAGAADAALTASGVRRDGRAAVVLVPVPSRASSTRARGHDPTATTTAEAARRLDAPGVPVTTARLLRLRPGVLDQSGLDAVARRANLAGAMAARGRELRRLARTHRRIHVVLCDDVVTTGSTLEEAARALRATGLPVLATVAVAATVRRSAPPTQPPQPPQPIQPPA